MQLLLFTTRLLSLRGEFDGYERFADELAGLPDALVAVAEQAEPVASDFAEAHAETDYHFLVGGGNLWGFTYLYSMCILEEMQWLRTTRVHSAEFFHGSLELLEEDTSVIVFQGEDETRALNDGVQRSGKKVSKNVKALDMRDYPLEGFTRSSAASGSDRARHRNGPRSKHLERVRNHSLDLCRDYRVVEHRSALLPTIRGMPRPGLRSSGASATIPRTPTMRVLGSGDNIVDGFLDRGLTILVATA